MIVIYIIKFIIVYIILYILALMIYFSIYFTVKNKSYRKKIGVLGLNKKNEIIMIYSIKSILEYYKCKNRKSKFFRECLMFLKALDSNVEYKTQTHKIILEKMTELKEIKIISSEYHKKRKNIIPKLLIGNFKNLFEEVEFYNIKFKKVKKS